MDESRFWTIIDNAWNSAPQLQQFRAAVLKTVGSESERESFPSVVSVRDCCIPDLEVFIEAIRQQIDELSQDELLTFDRIIERKLYDIDRQEIHEYTDGGDDVFLYCRGFIVAIGKEFYDAVNREPSNALLDFECYEITYLAQQLFEEKFGEMPRSDISRESFSNIDCWSEE